MSETKAEKQQAQGLKIDKKTVISITALLFVIMIFAGVLTQIIPRGVFQTDAEGMVVEGTYSRFEGDEGRLPWWKIIAAPVLVFGSSQATLGLGIIAFIVLIGGTFLILDQSGVLKFIMSAVVSRFEKKKYLLLAMTVLALMVMASVMGILEESITLVPLAVAISLALGWDSFVGLGMSLIAIAFGYTAATFNPFNVVVVQSMAELPLFSGLLYRIVVFIAVYAVLTGYLIVYAKRIEKHPEKSLSYKGDIELRERFSADVDKEALANPALKKATITFISCVSCVFVVFAISFALQKASFISDSLKDIISFLPMVAMAIFFTVGGLAAGRKAGIRGKALGAGFWQGIKTVAPCLPIIWFIMCITYILQEGNIIHTILNFVYEATAGLSSTQALFAILIFVVVLEFIVGSGTAKAFLIMPIVLPLADLLNVSRQSVVLAFTMGDGFCNILYPTSGIMIIAIGIVGISYGKYMRWSWKLFVLEFAVAALLLLGAVAIGY